LWVAGVVPVGGGDVVMAVEAEQADREAAEGGHHTGCVSGPDLGFVFLVGDVADPVEFVLCDTRSRMRVNSQVGGRVMPDV
jgi:hypothetical protein